MEVENCLNSIIDSGNVTFGTLVKSIVKTKYIPTLIKLVKSKLGTDEDKTLANLFKSPNDYSYLYIFIADHPDPEALIKKLNTCPNNIKTFLIKSMDVSNKHSRKILYRLLAKYDNNITIGAEDIKIAYKMHFQYGFKFNLVLMKNYSLPRIFEMLFKLINANAIKSVDKDLRFVIPNCEGPSLSRKDLNNTVVLNSKEVSTIINDTRIDAYPSGVSFQIESLWKRNELVIERDFKSFLVGKGANTEVYLYYLGYDVNIFSNYCWSLIKIASLISIGFWACVGLIILAVELDII